MKYIVRKKQYFYTNPDNPAKNEVYEPGHVFEADDDFVKGQTHKIEPYAEPPKEKKLKPKLNAAMKEAPNDRAM